MLELLLLFLFLLLLLFLLLFLTSGQGSYPYQQHPPKKQDTMVGTRTAQPLVQTYRLRLCRSEMAPKWSETTPTPAPGLLTDLMASPWHFFFISQPFPFISRKKLPGEMVVSVPTQHHTGVWG